MKIDRINEQKGQKLPAQPLTNLSEAEKAIRLEEGAEQIRETLEVLDAGLYRICFCPLVY